MVNKARLMGAKTLCAGRRQVTINAGHLSVRVYVSCRTQNCLQGLRSQARPQTHLGIALSLRLHLCFLLGCLCLPGDLLLS